MSALAARRRASVRRRGSDRRPGDCRRRRRRDDAKDGVPAQTCSRLRHTSSSSRARRQAQGINVLLRDCARPPSRQTLGRVGRALPNVGAGLSSDSCSRENAQHHYADGARCGAIITRGARERTERPGRRDHHRAGVEVLPSRPSNACNDRFVMFQHRSLAEYVSSAERAPDRVRPRDGRNWASRSGGG